MSLQNPVFIPGPTNIPEAVRKACDMPTIDHRSPLFATILHPALDGVRRVMRQDCGETFVFPATGTGGWEAALTNTLSRATGCSRLGTACSAKSGSTCAQRFGLQVTQVDVEWGDGVPVARFEELLREDRATRSRRSSRRITKRRRAWCRISKDCGARWTQRGTGRSCSRTG